MACNRIPSKSTQGRRLDKKSEQGEVMNTFERLEFPDVSDIDIAFGAYPHDWFASVMKIESLPEDQKWNDLADSLFYKGGNIPFDESLSEEYQIKGSRILRAVLGSWAPKHEHKEKVCGLIIKSLCEVTHG